MHIALRLTLVHSDLDWNDRFSAKPWYKPEQKGIWKLWENIAVRVGFISPDAVPGPRLRSQGYRIEELVSDPKPLSVSI